MEKEQLKIILEAVLMAASSPLNVDALLNVFNEDQRPERDELQVILDEMLSECDVHSYELKRVNSGYRFQVKKDFSDYISRLSDDKPARYSRALLETMALIAYRQPLTRGEIEAVRGVSVSSQIIKTLDERNWIKVVGHRDVPGKPALYATTKEFLDYFNLESLDALPSLQDIRDIDEINAELDLRIPEDKAVMNEQADAENVLVEEQTADDHEGMIALEITDDPGEAAEHNDNAADQETLASDDSEMAEGSEELTSSSEDNTFVQGEVSTTDDSDTVVDLAADDGSEDDTGQVVSSSEDDSADVGNGQRDAASASVES